MPFPHMPEENGKFSQDSQHLPAAPGWLRRAGGRAGWRGEEAPLTWHTKAPHTSGERRHLQVWGPLHARQWEIPAALEPQPDPPPEAFSPPPAAPGAPRCLCLGAGEPQAGEGVSWWRLGLAVAPPREGGSPGAQRGFTHGARHSRPCPRPARRPLGRLAGIALCK